MKLPSALVLTNIVPFPCSEAELAVKGINNIMLFFPALWSVTAVVVAEAVKVTFVALLSVVAIAVVLVQLIVAVTS